MVVLLAVFFTIFGCGMFAALQKIDKEKMTNILNIYNFINGIILIGAFFFILSCLMGNDSEGVYFILSVIGIGVVVGLAWAFGGLKLK
jgi:hypothetical protein